MRLTTLILTAALAIGLTSCDDFSGEFVAKQPLRLKHTTIFGKTKRKKVPTGTYRAKLGFSSANKVKLSLKKSGKDIDIKIKLPSGTRFPTYKGPIDIPASETRQPYDMRGKVNSRVTESDSVSTYESCTYTRQVRRCDRVCKNVTKPNGKVVKRCRRECRNETVTRNGSRDVTYYMIHTFKKIKLGVFTPNSTINVGTFRGTFNDSQKVYDYYGQCL